MTYCTIEEAWGTLYNQNKNNNNYLENNDKHTSNKIQNDEQYNINQQDSFNNCNNHDLYNKYIEYAKIQDEKYT